MRDGEIVVALVDGAETTLKRFYRESNEMVACSRQTLDEPDYGAIKRIAVAGPGTGGATEIQLKVSGKQGRPITFRRTPDQFATWQETDSRTGFQFLFSLEPVSLCRATLAAARFPIGIRQPGNLFLCDDAHGVSAGAMVLVVFVVCL